METQEEVLKIIENKKNNKMDWQTPEIFRLDVGQTENNMTDQPIMDANYALSS